MNKKRNTTVIELKKTFVHNGFVCYDIVGYNDKYTLGEIVIDYIHIENRKYPGNTRRTSRNHATWSMHDRFRSASIGDALTYLSRLGFDTDEFESVCIELGWEDEVLKWREEKPKWLFQQAI